MLKYAFNLIDDGLVGQQLFAGEATRLAYMTDEAVEGRDAFLEKRAPGLVALPLALLMTRAASLGWTGRRPAVGRAAASRLRAGAGRRARRCCRGRPGCRYLAPDADRRRRAPRS